MLKPSTPLPLRLRLLNVVGTHLGAARLPVAKLDEETLVRAAVKETGLTDFGSPYYREALLALLDSLENDAALHFAGRVANREVIVGSLINRLLLTQARKRTPAVFQRPLKPPIVVLGLPRSGTTLLHRLLAMDPAHRAVPCGNWRVQCQELTLKDSRIVVAKSYRRSYTGVKRRCLTSTANTTLA